MKSNVQIKPLVVALSALAVVGCSSALKPTFNKDDLFSDSKAKFDELYNAPIPPGPINLGQSVALVLGRNLDIKVKEAESLIHATRKGQTILEHMPSLVYNRDKRRRNKLALTTSERLNDIGDVDQIDEVDTNPSYSSELDSDTSDLTFEIDLLNLFQLGYDLNTFKADKQIRNLNRVKAAQNVTRDTLEQFTLAQMAQSLTPQINGLLADIGRLKSGTCSVIGSGGTSAKAKLLNHCESAVSSSRALNRIKKQLTDARINFNALITAHPTARVNLTPINMTEMPRVTKSLDELIDTALANSTELAIERFKWIIAKNEQYSAWTDIFPSLKLGVAYKTDENKFVVNNSWRERYVALNWNIIQKVISAPYRARTAKYEAMLADDARSKAAIVVLATKVAMSVENFNNAIDRWENSNQYALIKRDQHYAADARRAKLSEFDVIKAKQEMLSSRLQSMIDYGDLRSAAARLYGALGTRIIPDDHEFGDYSPEALSQAFNARFSELVGLKG